MSKDNPILKYEWMDRDEAMYAFAKYKRASSETCVWPTFRIHHIDIDLDGDMTMWLELIKEE